MKSLLGLVLLLFVGSSFGASSMTVQSLNMGSCWSYKSKDTLKVASFGSSSTKYFTIDDITEHFKEVKKQLKGKNISFTAKSIKSYIHCSSSNVSLVLNLVNEDGQRICSWKSFAKAGGVTVGIENAKVAGSCHGFLPGQIMLGGHGSSANDVKAQLKEKYGNKYKVVKSYSNIVIIAVEPFKELALIKEFEKLSSVKFAEVNHYLSLVGEFQHFKDIN